PTGSVDPNFGRRVRNRRQLNSLQNTWPYGYSMPIAVRYTQDAFSRSGWLWPVDAKGEPLKADRKSGSAGMPRPISYAVFCLKKKRKKGVTARDDRIYCDTALLHMHIHDHYTNIHFIFFFFNDPATTEIYTSFPTRRSSDL